MFQFGKKLALIGFALAAACATYATPAAAQATRTWVSGVGDDVNPCSRTAPCKTFAGAISKTAPGGEINCLDPGGFGGVTIVKSMTISCQYTEGGALAGGNGITVNAGPADTVYLRGLDIFGVSPQLNGVRFVAGGALIIEDSTIRRFNASGSYGISFQPSGASVLLVNNTTISDNGNQIANNGGGILVKPTGVNGSARVTLSNVRVDANAGMGIQIDTTGATNPGGTVVTLEHSRVTRNAAGVQLLVPVGAQTAQAMIVHSSISNNFAKGLHADGSGASVRVGNTTISGNASGVSIANLGQILTYGDNRLDGNNADGLFTGSIGKK